MSEDVGCRKCREEEIEKIYKLGINVLLFASFSVFL